MGSWGYEGYVPGMGVLVGGGGCIGGQYGEYGGYVTDVEQLTFDGVSIKGNK